MTLALNTTVVTDERRAKWGAATPYDSVCLWTFVQMTKVAATMVFPPRLDQDLYGNLCRPQHGRFSARPLRRETLGHEHGHRGQQRGRRAEHCEPVAVPHI